MAGIVRSSVMSTQAGSRKGKPDVESEPNHISPTYGIVTVAPSPGMTLCSSGGVRADQPAVNVKAGVVPGETWEA